MSLWEQAPPAIDELIRPIWEIVQALPDGYEVCIAPNGATVTIDGVQFAIKFYAGDGLPVIVHLPTSRT